MLQVSALPSFVLSARTDPGELKMTATGVLPEAHVISYLKGVMAFEKAFENEALTCLFSVIWSKSSRGR